MSATKDLKEDHVIVRRLGAIAQKCSNKLSANEPIPLEDIKIVSVIIEEFVDSFIMVKRKKCISQKQKVEIILLRISANFLSNMNLEGGLPEC